MAAFFSDTFPGSGNLNGHAPDTAYGGLNWAQQSGTINEVSGYARVPDGGGPEYGSTATYRYGSPASSYSNPQSVTVDFTWRTGVNADTSEAHNGLSINLWLNDVATAYVRIRRYYGNPWTLTFGTDEWSPTWSVNVNANVTNSADHNGAITYNAATGNCNLVFLGQNIDFTVTGGGDTNGFRALEIYMGETEGLGIISATELAVPNTGYALFQPLQATGYGGGWRGQYADLKALQVVGYGAGRSAIALPSAMATITGASALNYSNNTLPPFAALGRGGAYLAKSLPALKAYGIGNQITKDINYVAGALVAVGYGGATAKLTAPAFAVNLTGTFPNIGRLTVSLPALRTSGSVTIGEIGGIAARARALTAQGYGGANLVGVLGTLDAAGSGRSGNVARAALVLPKLAVMANGTVNGVNRAEIILPALAAGPYGSGAATFGALAALGYGRLVVEIIYEAYAINLKPRESRRPGTKPINEVTRYADVPFDGQFMYQGNCYGWGPGGLYLIGGETDDTVPIPYVMRTHPDDFGSTEKKTMRSAYFGGRFGPDATITLISGKEGENAYPYTTPRGVVAQNHRQKFGRGIKDRYLALEIAGEGALELDNFDPEVDKLTRRI